jgi:hypothetical protein
MNVATCRWPRERTGAIDVVFGALALSFASVAAAQTKVYDTGYEISRLVTSPSLHWIDNNRLLFAGIKTVDMDGRSRRRSRIGRSASRSSTCGMARRTRSSSTPMHAGSASRTVSFATPCAVDSAARQIVVREGPFGEEKEMAIPRPSKEELSIQGQRVHSNFTCKSHVRSELVPPAPRFRKIVVLREGDGYLDMGPGGGNDYFEERRAYPRNLTLYVGATGRAVSLPMTWEEEISPLEVAYSTYRGAYVLRPQMPRGSPLGRIRAWPKDQPLVVYLLWADGRTEAISIPYSPVEFVEHPRPLRAGWIFGGGKQRRTGGLYVLGKNTLTTVEAGLVSEISVSRDGCKAAVGINNTPTKWALRSISKCSISVCRL